MPIRSQGFPIRFLSRARTARSSALVFGALAAAVLSNLSGCHAMSSPQEAGMELAVKIDTSEPIRFSTHAFGAHCFGGAGCRVEYSGRVIRNRSDNELNPPLPSTDLGELIVAPHIGIPNFPAPASVSWTSEDGDSLQALVDIGAIFADQLVRHDVPAAELPRFLYSEIEPEILVVVRDRQLDVFMRARIPIANEGAGVRNSLVLVDSQTY